MPTILAISGSPSATSRTERLVDLLAVRLADAGHEVRALSIRDLPPAGAGAHRARLLPARSTDPDHGRRREVIEANAAPALHAVVDTFAQALMPRGMPIAA
jgi:FMN reductase